ncbi:2-oxoacid:acceptor oxidoreductase subunit alpha [Thermopolyspora sp. NPDC052614]|uniref:2-oxoacid:acceptor oxidoreductase subunit alpha n=1 Tax=Thermopolyspora sp. NPDC052614 TaxID=3155682 RepID=UPI0034304BD1
MTADQLTQRPPREVRRLDRVVIRFAGDSGDGMQLIGDRFTAQVAASGNDLAIQPNYPAEIRAPAGTLRGVSSFQVHFADHDILTAGDRCDALVAMNPAALKANIDDLKPGGVLIVDSRGFTKRALERVGYAEDPLEDGSLDGHTVHAVDLTGLAGEAVAGIGLSRKDTLRVKNMFALGLVSWMYSRPIEPTVAFLRRRFSARPELAEANVAALRAGWNYGETTETFAVTYQVKPAMLPPGTYRNIHGNLATAYGLLAASRRAGTNLFLGAYPITPASDVMHELSKLKSFGVHSFQAEDEIAAIGAALGASYAGMLGVTVTSSPGMALKTETIGLAVALELPLVIVNVQRGGPSTGLPTRTEQADLFQAMYGRNGEAPVPVLAPRSPSDCFDTAIEACRIAFTHRTPVILLSDAAVANGSEPWRVPALDELPDLRIEYATTPNGLDADGNEVFLPYARDPETLARPLALPGTPGLAHRIGGLEKADLTGEISYDPDNHDLMVRNRQDKIDRVAVPDLEVHDPAGPPGYGARVLVIGWGSTYGPIGAACRRVRRRGLAIAQAHLRHLNPLPANLPEVLSAYDTVLVPEMNLGQLATLLRATCLVDTVGYTQTRGMPFQVAELENVFVNVIMGGDPR